MAQLFRMSDYAFPWKKIFHDDSGDTTLEIHMNIGTCELEVLSYNDEGECLRKQLSTVESMTLQYIINDSIEKNINGQE